MQHDAAFHQGMHCLLRFKQPSGTEIHHNLETSTCDPLKYTMGSPLPVVSLCMGKSIRIQGLSDIHCIVFFYISAPGLYAAQELIDFGILRTLDEPKIVAVNLINTGNTAIQITVSRTRIANF